MMTVFGLCMTVALCNLLMQKNRFSNAIRLVLGLEISRAMISVLQIPLKALFKWS